MRWMPTLFVFCLLFAQISLAQPATAPAGVDPTLWKQMVAINAKGETVQDLKATFEQKKFTPLLKKPLVSTGEVRVRGATMRWDTQAPAATVMLINEKEVHLYYPQQKVVEIYKIDQQLSSLAASPLPRLDVLAKHFTFEKIAGKLMRVEGDPPNTLALRLVPTDPSLKENVDEVRVLIDEDEGYILRFEMTDADGDRTVIAFSGIQTNTKLPQSEMELALPSDVRISRPLEALEGK